MKTRTSIISFVFLMCCLSCTQKLIVPDDPQVDAAAVTILNAEVRPLVLDGYGQRDWIWTKETAVGMYGSEGGANMKWIPRSQYHDSSSFAVIYGPEVSGELFGYLPYIKDGHDSLAVGKAPLPAQQKYYAHPADHLIGNSYLVSKAVGDSLIFDWALGLLRIEVKLEIEGNVKSVVLASMEKDLSDAGNSVEIVEIDRPCTKKEPLELWLALPEGTYNNFSISVFNGVKNTVRPVEGTFVVAPMTITECPAADKEYDYGLGDFEIENGEYE